jgi:hypothetical protein
LASISQSTAASASASAAEIQATYWDESVFGSMVLCSDLSVSPIRQATFICGGFLG